MNGLANFLDTKYFYFKAPLRMLKAAKEKALIFKSQIIHMQNNDTKLIDSIEFIDSKIRIIDARINFLENKGWNGLLDLQRLTATKRASLLTKNSKCQQATKLFLGNSKLISTVDEFEINTDSYKIATDFCVKEVAK